MKCSSLELHRKALTRTLLRQRPKLPLTLPVLPLRPRIRVPPADLLSQIAPLALVALHARDEKPPSAVLNLTLKVLAAEDALHAAPARLAEALVLAREVPRKGLRFVVLILVVGAGDEVDVQIVVADLQALDEVFVVVAVERGADHVFDVHDYQRMGT